MMKDASWSWMYHEDGGTGLALGGPAAAQEGALKALLLNRRASDRFKWHSRQVRRAAVPRKICDAPRYATSPPCATSPHF